VNRGLHSLTFNKAELLERMRANRDRHRQVFEEALEGYRAQMVAELETMLGDARAGRRIRRSVQLPEPRDHTRDYDRVILMLELAETERITLSEVEFSQYVLDEWGWRADFLSTSAAYSRRAARLLDETSGWQD
jgi:hypothetical protein